MAKIRYPIGIQNSNKLLSLSVQYYWFALKKIFGFILTCVVLKSLYTYSHFARPVEIALGWLLAISIIFLFIWALVTVDKDFRGETFSLADTFKLSLYSCWKAYLICILGIIIFMLLFILGRWVIVDLSKIQGAVAGFAMVFLVGIPFVLILIYFYLSIPLSVIYPQSLGSILYYSAFYAQKRFLLVLVIYSELIIMFFISSTHTRHSQWLLNHHLMELTDLVTLIIFMPLLINLSLLLLYDCRQRVS